MFQILNNNKRSSLSYVYYYGFNGKENDDEVKGEGSQQDYGMWVCDPRLGRFLSVDPLTKSYPELTPYQFASNRPIDGVDLDGGEYKSKSYYKTIVTSQSVLQVVDNKYVWKEVWVLAVSTNPANMPDYYKENNMTPEPTFIEGYDIGLYTNGIGKKI